MDKNKFSEFFPNLLFNELQSGSNNFRQNTFQVLSASSTQEAKCKARDLIVNKEGFSTGGEKLNIFQNQVGSF